MENIRCFNTAQEFSNFIKEETIVDTLGKKTRRLGFGSEGDVYLTRDKKALKIITNNIEVYDYKKIITANMVKSENFLFPEELYLVNDILCGYKTKAVKKDYFYGLITPDKYINLDIEKLESAIIRFKEEFERLSNMGIYMFDLPGNVMYDGEDIYAIDTCAYSFDKLAKEKNEGTFDYTIKTIFNPLLDYASDSVEDINSLELDDIGGYLLQIYFYCIGKMQREKVLIRK